MVEYYNADLEDMALAGDFKRMAMLTRQLPPQSRTLTRLEPRARWDEHAYLLALIADHLSFLRYEQSGGKGKRPKPLDRPEGREPEREHLAVDDGRIQDLLFASREGACDGGRGKGLGSPDPAVR